MLLLLVDVKETFSSSSNCKQKQMACFSSARRCTIRCDTIQTCNECNNKRKSCLIICLSKKMKLKRKIRKLLKLL